MSDHSLRETLRARLSEQVSIETDLLTERTGDSESQMRTRLGVILGLKRAVIILDQVYRDLHG